MAQITFTNTGGITATGAISGASVYSNGSQCLTAAITSLATASSGSGNVVSDITVSGNTITKVKGITALTGETSLTTVASGTGNVISDITVSGHQITKVKGITAYTKPSGGIPEADLASAVATKLNSGSNKIFYGTCTTAKATADKVATLTDNTGFTLTTGVCVAIKFTYASAAAPMTLNVNNTGAKTIVRYGTTEASSGTTTSGWVAGSIGIFFYDGTYWVRDYWNNTTYSGMTQAEIDDGTSTTNRLISPSLFVDNISGKEDLSNKVTSISSSSTDTQYPSAKCVYDAIQAGGSNVEYTTNKVTSVSSSSTDTQYPSAKAAYTLVMDNKFDIATASEASGVISLTGAGDSSSASFASYASYASVASTANLASIASLASVASTANAVPWTGVSGRPTGIELTSNKVTTLSSSATDTQYPSAKCVYDIVGNVVTALETLLG